MREVDLDEIAVSATATCLRSEGSPLFVANGISTCIAIILHGEVKGAPFAAMLHWSGFEAEINRKNKALMFLAVYLLFSKIEQQIINELNLAADSPISIKNVNIIGGERKQKDASHRLLVSGTELEVNYLKKYAKDICEEIFEIQSEASIQFTNYITTNNDVVNIQVFLDGLNYQHIRETSASKLPKGPKNYLIAVDSIQPTIEPEPDRRYNGALT